MAALIAATLFLPSVASAEEAKPIDVFLVAGQSNAEGRGQPAMLPTVPDGVGYEFLDDGGIVAMARREGVFGSAWHAFANAMHRATGRPVLVVNSARGGTALIAETGGPNWSATGDLFEAAVQRTRSALDELAEEGWRPTLRGVLWHHGERDAQGYRGSDLRERYSDALVDLSERFRVAFDQPDLPLFVWQVGRPLSADSARFAAVRDAQMDANGLGGVTVVYDQCATFAEHGWMRDELHYGQDALNDMGTVGGAVVAEWFPAVMGGSWSPETARAVQARHFG